MRGTPTNAASGRAESNACLADAVFMIRDAAESPPPTRGFSAWMIWSPASMNPKDLASAEILLQDWLEEGVRLFSADAPPQADIAYLERWEKILIRLLYHQQSLFVESADDPQLQKTAHAFSSFLSRHAG